MRGIVFGFSLLLAIPLQAGEPSGPKVGSDVGPFHVLDVTGPSAGKELCYRCKYGEVPVVAVFAPKVDDNLAVLCKAIDGKIGSGKGLQAMVVVVTEDVPGHTAALKELAQKHGIKKLPLTIFKGKEGPENYAIDLRQAATLVLWDESVVKQTATIADSSKIRTKAILAAIEKLAAN